MNEPYDPFDKLHSDELHSDEQGSRFAQLSEMEQKLKQFRPRPPELDIEAIVLMAKDEDAFMHINATVQEGVAKYSRSQLIGTVAASWLCGVVVGAACIFYSISSPKPASQQLESFASDIRTHGDEIESTASSIQQSINTMTSSDGDLSAAITDDWRFDLNADPLQVGMSLRSRRRLVRAIDQSRSRLPVRPKNRNSERDSSIANESSPFADSRNIHFSPPLPTTKAELLKELLRESTRGVH